MTTLKDASRGFDTTRPGAPERLWQSWTADLPEWVLPAGDLLVVSPHPDDETLGAGGLMQRSHREGRAVTVVSLTDGEAACPEIPCLARVRRLELIEAMARLGISADRIVRLGLPDGHVSEHESHLEHVLTTLGESFGALIAPFELDGHPDHDAAGRAAARAAAALGRPLGRYPIWAWHQGSTTLRSADSAVRVSFDETARRAKEHAINQFHSQLGKRAGGAIVPEHVLDYFRRDHEVFLL